MMGATGEPWGYYPTDTNGLAVQNQLPMACVCYIFLQSLCAPIVDGGCSDEDKKFEDCIKKCRKKHGRAFWRCFASCIGNKIADKLIDDLLGEICVKNFCKVFSSIPQCQKGDPCKIENPDPVDCQNCCDIKWACCVANIRGGWWPPFKGWFEWNRCYAERASCYSNCN